MCGVEISDLPCLASGHNSNLNYEDMADLWHQDIAVDDYKNPSPEKIPVPGNIPLPQLEDDNSWILEGIIFPRRSKHLHNTNVDFRNYTREEVMKMKILELFSILFHVEYLKDILIPKTNNLLKNPMDLGSFIRWLGCWFYMGCWVRTLNRRNWWSTEDTTMFGGSPFILNKYMSRNRFEVILGCLHYTDQKYVEYYYGFFHMRKME